MSWLDNRHIIIFGDNDFCEMSIFYFRQQSRHISAITKDRDFIQENTRYGIPVIPFDEIQVTHKPGNYLMFMPLAGDDRNELRKTKYLEAKSKGYDFATFIHPTAIVWNKLNIGENCFIQELNNIQYGTTVGNNVMMWAGNHIGHHGKIGDHSFFTSHVVLSGHCNVGEQSWFGVNSTIRNGLTIAPKTLIGMGALVTKDTEEGGTYIGSPARNINK